MKTISMFLLFSILVLSNGVCGEIYMWTDENGVKRFSNTGAPPGAQVVGKEINYQKPPNSNYEHIEPIQTKPSKSQTDQVEIEKQKTAQKRLELLTEKERTQQGVFDSLNKTMEQTTKSINSLLGRPIR